jgi:6-phosphogluconolactonase
MLQAGAMDVYFGTGGGEGIFRAAFDPATGKLSEAELVAELDAPGFLAVHGGVLYAVAAGPGDPGVFAFRIQQGGGLERIGSSPTGDGVAAHVAVHPSGAFLLTAQYGGGSVALFPLGAEGKPGPATLYRHEGGTGIVGKRQDSPHPHWCGFSPDGAFALVPDLGLDGIVIYRVNPDGPALEPHGFAASEPGGGARHMRFSPDGRFIYLVNELTSTLSIFAWDAVGGSARLLATVPALGKDVMDAGAMNAAAEILVHPSGRFLYYSNRGNDSVSVFRADPATAAAEVIQTQPVRGAFPRHIALSPCANWLLAAGADSNTVAVHRLDPQSGKLTFQTRGVINVPKPICILFAGPSPDGHTKP